MNKLRIRLLLLIFVLVICGCATWQLIGKSNAGWKKGYCGAQLPQGWVKYNSPIHLLFLTKDGIFLQQITVTKMRTDKELPSCKKKIKEGMLVQEISEIIVDELSLNKSLYNFKVLESKPSKIDKIDGFKLSYSYNNEDFLKYECITYGFMFDKNYYEIRYLAAKQHYFDKGMPDFEEFIGSFKIVKK